MAQSSTQVSIVVPTFNESKNVQVLIDGISRVLVQYRWEVIFVDDDSPDLTWKTVKDIANNDSRVRCLRRVGRRGLSGACIEGILSSAAPVAIVMDGDLQHDEGILPKMIEGIMGGNFDLVAGSRYIEGGSHHDGFSPLRAIASRLATFLAHKATRTDVSDVMSGFFALRRECFDGIATKLSTSGFKILLDILSTAGPTLRVSEVEYGFRKREDGASKFDIRAMGDFVGLLVNKATNGLIPTRFVQFALVGTLGILVHVAVLKTAMGLLNMEFAAGQIAATLVAMNSNFFINNLLTYRDMKLKGFALLRGLLFFCIICSMGALGNFGIASWVFGQSHLWLLSGLAGAMLSSVWNYAISAALVWRR